MDRGAPLAAEGDTDIRPKASTHQQWFLRTNVGATRFPGTPLRSAPGCGKVGFRPTADSPFTALASRLIRRLHHGQADEDGAGSQAEDVQEPSGAVHHH